MKLNIGSAAVRRPGFLHVDIRADSGPDIISAAWDLAEAPDGSVEEIYSRHMLEHLKLSDAKRAIERWFALLRPCGSLNVMVPDLLFDARQLLGSETSAANLFPA